MNIQYFSDFNKMSQAAFHIVQKEIELKPDLLFCVASGGSPSGLYAEMVSEKSRNPEFCSRLRVIKLDEWGGLEPGSDFTSELDVQKKFIQPLGISQERYWTIDPFTDDPERDCLVMENTIQQKGPLDICILGIGTNGHIALNEPSYTFQVGFHKCELAPSTLNNGMIKSLQQPPSFGMTMGMGNILQSKKILLFIAGSGKKEAFQKLLTKEVSMALPASFLWLHPDVEVLVDESAV
ncbi:6-phosphogluconolactonase [Algoriphagus mannitolivorans]|uniref:6-phosphogluconolactonase n=1 Tax=Algoriphagus mannitolivorans TaxID=226504 RepID=UPI000402D7E7|nr:6-phosphogluconolactonase [Algoriphagus mannitolivorans]